MTTTKKKPPTQIAGVKGIAPKPIELTPAQPEQFNWAKILELPPFQMFAVEQEPSLSVAFGNILSNGIPLWEQHKSIDAWLHTYQPEELYRQYAEWHLAKGYWPNETPDGQLIGDDDAANG